MDATTDANVLFQQANLNETFVDGDAKSVSLLVLSMQKCWDQRRGGKTELFPVFFPGGFSQRWEVFR